MSSNNQIEIEELEIKELEIEEQVLSHYISHYKSIVESKYPDKLTFWPLLSGFDAKIGKFGEWVIIYFEHTANPLGKTVTSIGEKGGVIGFNRITEENIQEIRSRLEKHFNAKTSDAVAIIHPQQSIENELMAMFQKHEFHMGLVPMKVFLSHKGADKPLIREFKNTLSLLGFELWFDEYDMTAGTELERGLLKGFNDSCAAVFFITPNFKDENYIATEVNYAIAEKRKKGDKFSIITIVLGDKDKCIVPDLLKTYVWKEPSNHLEALREIIRALPVKVGEVYWRN